MEQDAASAFTPDWPCRNLRSKSMYYQGEDDDGLFWCAQTQENTGPDGAPTGKTECCHGRCCYVG
jgi:hypothetical protein